MSLMASLAMDMADGCDDYLPLPPVEEEEDADDDGYLPLPPVEEEDVDEYMQMQDDDYYDEDEEEDGRDYMHLLFIPRPLARIVPRVGIAGAPHDPAAGEYTDLSESSTEEEREEMQLGSFGDVLRHALISYRLADIIPRLPVVAAAPNDDTAVAEALKTVDAASDGSDCPICMDDGEEEWKETPCGHRFHGRCVERWLLAKGTCPLCRCQLTTPTDNTQGLLVEMEVIYQEYGPDVAMELQDELLL